MGIGQIFIMNADGTGLRQITSNSSWSCTRPSWSPDGKRIVYGGTSAFNPRGMGFSSVGTKLPECARRIFFINVDTPTAEPTMVTDDDVALRHSRRLMNSRIVKEYAISIQQCE